MRQHEGPLFLRRLCGLRCRGRDPAQPPQRGNRGQQTQYARHPQPQRGLQQAGRHGSHHGHKQQQRRQVGQQGRHCAGHHQRRIGPRLLPQTADSSGRRGKARKKAGDGQSPARAQNALREMTEHPHRHHQHHDAPDQHGADGAPGVNRFLRQQGHHHQSRCAQQQGILNFTLADPFAADFLQRHLGLQQDGHHHPQRPGQRRLVRRQRAQHGGHQHGHFAGHAGVVLGRLQIGAQRQGRHGHQRRNQHPGPQHPADTAHQRHQRMGT